MSDLIPKDQQGIRTVPHWKHTFKYGLVLTLTCKRPQSFWNEVSSSASESTHWALPDCPANLSEFLKPQTPWSSSHVAELIPCVQATPESPHPMGLGCLLFLVVGAEMETHSLGGRRAGSLRLHS